MLAAIALWFVPMMLVTAAGGELLQYRNEILFHQTVTRYSDAWHHHEPFWYYPINVIPLLWLPLIALVPWLWSRWRVAIGQRDTFVAVLLAWVVLVVLFFSSSAGKRGVYVLPAVPALAWRRRRGCQRSCVLSRPPARLRACVGVGDRFPAGRDLFRDRRERGAKIVSRVRPGTGIAVCARRDRCWCGAGFVPRA